MSFSWKLHFVALRVHFVGNLIISSNTDTLGWWPSTHNSISPVFEEVGMTLKNQLRTGGMYNQRLRVLEVTH